MTGESVQVPVAGGTLAVKAIGAGPPVLLIHGTAPAIWGTLPELLAPGHRVFSYDRRTFGAARGLTADDLSVHADDAAAILGVCGSPATVVGWSIGGVIALELAASHPDLVASMVLLEPPLHAKRHPNPRMISAIAGAAILGKVGRPEAGARRFLRWALGRRDGSSDLERMPDDWHDRLAAGDARAVVGELAHGTGEHMDVDALSRIDVPVDVLRGDRSQPAFGAAAQRVAASMTGCRCIDVVGGGHAIQLDAPELVAESVTALTVVTSV